MIFAVRYMLSIDGARGICACCSVSSHSDCLAGETDCGLDQCCTTRPCGPFLGQKTRVGSVGRLSSCWKAQCSYSSGQTPKISDQTEDTGVFEWILFLTPWFTKSKRG